MRNNCRFRKFYVTSIPSTITYFDDAITLHHHCFFFFFLFFVFGSTWKLISGLTHSLTHPHTLTRALANLPWEIHVILFTQDFSSLHFICFLSFFLPIRYNLIINLLNYPLSLFISSSVWSLLRFFLLSICSNLHPNSNPRWLLVKYTCQYGMWYVFFVGSPRRIFLTF